MFGYITFIYPKHQKIIKKYFNKPFSLYKLNTITTSELANLKNHGYLLAFAKTSFVKDSANYIFPYIAISPGKKFLFYNLQLPDSSHISKKFLQTFLNLSPNMPFNLSNFNKIPQKLRLLPFVQLKSQPQIILYNGLASVFLPIKIIPSNWIDANIGLILHNRQLIYTGNIMSNFINLFHHGENLSLQWDKNNQNRQTLNMNLYYPLLFNKPISSRLNLVLQKLDTTQLNSVLSLQFNFNPNPSNAVGLTFSHTAHFVSYNSDSTKNISFNTFGLNFRISTINSYLNPSSGLLLKFSLSAGKKNSNLPVIKQKALLEKYFKLSPSISILFSAKSFVYYSPKIYDNEISYFGGGPFLIGFNNYQFPATTMFAANLEPKFIFHNANIFLFGQIAQLYLKTVTRNAKTNATSLGLGINLISSKSLLNVVFAYGLENFRFSYSLPKLKISFKTIF